MQKKLKALILVLGLLQVVGTVKSAPFKSSSMHWSWTGFVVSICFFDVKLVSDFQVSSFISLSRPWKFSWPMEANFPCHVKTAAIPSPVVRRNLLRVFASTL